MRVDCDRELHNELRFWGRRDANSCGDAVDFEIVLLDELGDGGGLGRFGVSKQSLGCFVDLFVFWEYFIAALTRAL